MKNMSTIAAITPMIMTYHHFEIGDGGDGGCGPTAIVQFFQAIEYELLTINETLKVPLTDAIPETLIQVSFSQEMFSQEALDVRVNVLGLAKIFCSIEVLNQY